MQELGLCPTGFKLSSLPPVSCFKAVSKGRMSLYSLGQLQDVCSGEMGGLGGVWGGLEFLNLNTFALFKVFGRFSILAF